MRLNLLSTLTAAALFAPALASAAVSLAPQGQGLLFPYFTTEDGQATVISVSNASERAKALKIRVLESHAGRETLSFNIYLGARATWSASLAGDDASDAGRLVAGSRACTAPDLSPDGEALRPFAYTGSNADGGTPDLARTREGMIEIIELGTLSGALAAATVAPDITKCEVFERRFVDGPWDVDANLNTDISAPTGGLYGKAILIDVGAGTAFDYEALAFADLASAPRHTVPGNLRPMLSDIPVAQGENIEVLVPDGEGGSEILRYSSGQGADAISALLAHNTATTEYSVDAALGARTDWIVSFPTRRSYVDVGPGGLRPANQPPLAPFTSTSCETATLQRFDGDGAAVGGSNETVSLCGATHSLRFRAAAGASRLVDVDDGIDVIGDRSGTARLVLGDLATGPRRGRADAANRCWQGLPVWVLAVSAYDNANSQPGRIATYPESRVASATSRIIDCPAAQ